MTEQTVKETICICKDRNILKEYLMRREVEVITIMMSLFDDEQIMKTYWKDMENTLSEETQHHITLNFYKFDIKKATVMRFVEDF